MTSRKGLWLFALGAILTMSVVIVGKFFLPDWQNPGAGHFQGLQGRPAMLKFILFACGFPLGIGLSVWGASLFGASRGVRARLFAVAAVVGPLLMFLVPALAGTANSPLYFGTGGIILLVLILLAIWSWGHYRAGLAEAARTASDLQVLGYLCFALAAWNTCGVGGMPGFALYPAKMAQAETHFLVVANMKSVMVFFILGWLFTLLGFRKASG
jgi:hypothetical protein